MNSGTPSRIDFLTDEIRYVERRLSTIALSKPDHDRLSAYLAELHAERWYTIMDLKARKELAA
ncbi:MAG: hypothetical protein JO051_03250 [Acidobacteriaceae bacterium]|nr:hypothetical protein [Acidobacteriaceae bacterium]